MSTTSFAIYGLLRFALAILRTFGIRTIVLLPHVRSVCKVSIRIVQALRIDTLHPYIAHIPIKSNSSKETFKVASCFGFANLMSAARFVSL